MVVHHEDANDVLQNIFIKVWNVPGKLQGRFSTIYLALPHCYQRILSYLEQQKRKSSLSIDNEENPLINQLKAEKGFDANKAEWKLQLAIQQLPEKQRLVFNLRYYDEMPMKR